MSRPVLAAGRGLGPVRRRAGERTLRGVKPLPDGARVNSLLGRSLLTTHDWSVADLDALLSVAVRLEALDRSGVATDLLPNELAYAMFFDNSTRTKSAWAGAAARLGMHPVIVDGSSTQVSHGETAEETGAMLGMNAHALGVRHDLILGEGNSFMRDVLRGITDYLAASGDARVVPVVNLQCDLDHPTQSLADLIWLREHFGGSVAGRRITMSWAYSPSYAKPLSVPQGVVSLLTRFGAHVTLAHPEGYELLPEPMQWAAEGAVESGGSFRVTNDMDDAFAGAEAVYPKSWGPHALMAERVVANRAGDKDAMADIARRALRRTADGDDRRWWHGALPALPAGRHRCRGDRRCDGSLPCRSGEGSEQEGVRDHGAAGGSQGLRPGEPARRCWLKWGPR